MLTDTIGKEEAFVALHKEYKTKIVLNEERYEYAKQIFEEKTERIFTKERKKGWIEVIKRKEKDLVLKHEPKAILISLTGWANIRDFQKVSDN